MVCSLVNKLDLTIGDRIPMYHSKLQYWYFWTVREKKWYPPHRNYIYFLTKPGYENWFSTRHIQAQIKAYYQSSRQKQ